MNKIFTYCKALLCALLLIITVSACEKEIDVKLRSVEPEVVIEGVIQLDSLAKIRITTTKDFSSTNQYYPIKDAVVEIHNNAGNTETLTFNADGVYTTQTMRGAEHNTYHLLVKYNGKEYKATSQMPPLIKLDSLSLSKIPMFNYPSPVVHFQDPPGRENEYYRAVIYVNGKRIDTEEQRVFSSEFIKGQYINLTLFVFPKNGKDPIQQGDEIMIESQCIDKGVYTFFQNLANIEDALTNPTNNITGGALGYFSAYSFDRKTIKAVW